MLVKDALGTYTLRCSSVDELAEDLQSALDDIGARGLQQTLEVIVAGKSEHSPTRENQGESRAQPNQRLPKGHFTSDGLSTGRPAGPVRPSEDAYQGPRPKGEERE